MKVMKGKSGGTKGKTTSKPSTECVTHATRPKLGAVMPFVYKGCKVYHSVSASKWRVVPRPGESAFDKSFSYGKDGKHKSKMWLELLKYCEKPVTPKTSANYVK